MKSIYLRSMLALACVATVAGCGGTDRGSLLLGGTVTGLTRDGLVLTDESNGATLTVAANATTFTFAKLIPTQAAYNVTVTTNPAGATCTVSNGSARASNINVTTVAVTCKNTPHKLGGAVTGLAAGDILTLVNAPEQLTVTGDGSSPQSVTFATEVSEESKYSVGVLSSPAGKTCTVSGGTGTMPTTDVSTVAVTCN